MSARDPAWSSQPLDHCRNDYFVPVIDLVVVSEVGRCLEPSRGRGRAQLPLHESVVLSHVGVQSGSGEAAAVVSATQETSINQKYRHDVSGIFLCVNDSLTNSASPQQ